MARYLGSKCKKCRALGLSVCGSDRCAFLRRGNPPGMHPDLRRKLSDFKKRLIEKQKLRFFYWISERQFRNYVKEAFKKKGIPGEILLGLLERRVDRIVYRLGLAPTMLAARQMVLHSHILVNGRKVDRPSYSLREGEVVSVKEESKKMDLVAEGLARSSGRPSLLSLQVGKDNLKGKLTSIPERAQIPLEINEAMVMEHYTRYL